MCQTDPGVLCLQVHIYFIYRSPESDRRHQRSLTDKPITELSRETVKVSQNRIKNNFGILLYSELFKLYRFAEN